MNSLIIECSMITLYRDMHMIHTRHNENKVWQKEYTSSLYVRNMSLGALLTTTFVSNSHFVFWIHIVMFLYTDSSFCIFHCIVLLFYLRLCTYECMYYCMYVCKYVRIYTCCMWVFYGNIWSPDWSNMIFSCLSNNLMSILFIYFFYFIIVLIIWNVSYIHVYKWMQCICTIHKILLSW